MACGGFNDDEYLTLLPLIGDAIVLPRIRDGTMQPNSLDLLVTSSNFMLCGVSLPDVYNDGDLDVWVAFGQVDLDAGEEESFNGFQ